MSPMDSIIGQPYPSLTGQAGTSNLRAAALALPCGQYCLVIWSFPQALAVLQVTLMRVTPALKLLPIVSWPGPGYLLVHCCHDPAWAGPRV